MRLSDSQRRYIIKSRDAYQRLLDDAAQNPSLSPNENALLAVKLQLGECHRALGEYQLALDMFSDILKDKESSLSVQRAAAYTYQARGQSEAPQWLERAIHGGYKLKSTGQNRIWGWLKISQVALRASRNDEKHRDVFYEARVNIARCRYLAAIKRSGARRQQDLAKAKQSIQSVAQLYPDLGGDRWRGEFDTLLKQIQSAAGEQANGLREFSAGQPASTRNSPQS
jgi:tetratricopeptide (TPR) repeat protein